MYANKPSVPGLLDKLNVEIGSQYSHIYKVDHGLDHKLDLELDNTMK